MEKTHSGDIFDQLMEIVESKPDSKTEYKVELLRIALSMSLKEARERAGKTQKQMAESLGVQQPWVSKLESCNNDHTFESLARYVFALGADIALNAIFDGDAPMELASSKTDRAKKYEAGSLPKFIEPIADTIPQKGWSINSPKFINLIADAIPQKGWNIDSPTNHEHDGGAVFDVA
jgi:transcriptional regulator with XRE-family HTH domain